MLVPRVIKQTVMGSQVKTWKWKARKSKMKYQWWRGVDRSKIINMVSNLTGQKWKVRESKVGSDQRLWCNYGRSVKGHGSKVGMDERSVESKVGQVKDLGVIGHGVQHHQSEMLVPWVMKQTAMGSQVRTWKSKSSKSKVKYQWWRGVDWFKIINTAWNSHFKNGRLGSRRSARSKTMV